MANANVAEPFEEKILREEREARSEEKLKQIVANKPGWPVLDIKHGAHTALAIELLDQSRDWSKHDRTVREKLQEKICKLEADVFEAIFKDGFESHKKAFLAISQAKTNIMCYYAAHFTVK